MAVAAIGCSGFNYRHWRGNFYPEKLPQKQWFAHYFGIFPTVELNVTFYRLPSAETFDKWYRETPPHFTFAIKGSRFITHVKRLADSGDAVERYFEAALHLKEKLKVVLWQLSPGFSLNMDRFDAFLRLVGSYPVRNVFEFRNGSWLTPEVFDLCRHANVALCSADWPDFIVHPPETAEFVYFRRHGNDRRYTGSYSSEELAEDAQRIKGYLAEDRDVYIYFNNDIGGHAPQNAMELMGMME